MHTVLARLQVSEVVTMKKAAFFDGALRASCVMAPVLRHLGRTGFREDQKSTRGYVVGDGGMRARPTGQPRRRRRQRWSRADGRSTAIGTDTGLTSPTARVRA